MAIGDAITLVSCLAGLMLALPALLIFLNLAFARTTFAAAQRLHEGLRLPLIVGVIALAAVGIPASMLISMGSLFQLIGTLLYLALFTWAFTGLAALARMVGGRFSLLSDRPASLVQELGIGTIVVSLAVAFPLVGWLVLLPVGIVVGVGATILARKSPVFTTEESVAEAA